ncbi:MAG: hypothetical protein WA957_10485 [Alteraurantiacibacter sp.]
MFEKAKDMIPAPMAAPETEGLRSARLHVIVALALLAVVIAAWGPITSVIGVYALAIIGGLGTFLLIQIPLWIAAKNIADNHHLMSGD